jgi:hypothetical protein
VLPDHLDLFLGLILVVIQPDYIGLLVVVVETVDNMVGMVVELLSQLALLMLVVVQDQMHKGKQDHKALVVEEEDQKEIIRLLDQELHIPAVPVVLV